MGLFSKKKGAASLSLSPEVPVRATETITATVTVAEPLAEVSSAVVELGYVNRYRYRWAGREGAALSQGNDSWLTMDQVGTSYGSDKFTEDWVHVLEQPLLVAGGVLAVGTQQVALRVPSWAPGSSAETVRWQARLRVDRRGTDVEVEAPITVLVAAPEPAPATTDLPLVQGESALAHSLEFEIETERGCYRPGEEVRGFVAVTPRDPVDRKALVAGWFQRVEESHPLEKTPGGTTETFTRPMVTFEKDVQLVTGQRSEFAFALTLPSDADPTTEAVHCSVDWFLQIKVEFAGMTGGIERAQRGIIVHTA
ncbi:MAG: hypothetical protein ACJ72L_10665 [Marmoricola sp.]